MVHFTPERSDSIRANLINHVAENFRPRRRRTLWAAGLVLVGALAGAGVSAGALAGTETFGGGAESRVPNFGFAPNYVLPLESTGAIAQAPKDPYGTLELLGLDAAELRRYRNVEQLSVWSGESRDGVTCLLVAHPVQGLLEGIGDARCAHEGLHVVAEVPVCSGCSAPGAFASLPAGSLIRFVLNGDHVDVYVYERTADPVAPR